MKQKNLAMLGVAVGCGLVAAIAVAKLTAGGSRGPETTRVLVAKKDLPIQTKLEAKELDNLVTWAELPKNVVPPDAVTEIDQLKDKELNRTLKQGNPVSATDLGVPPSIVIPEGHKQITLRSNQWDSAAGFVRPGSKVDVLYTEKNGNGQARAGLILRNMLVLAVNMVDTLTEKTGRSIPQVESISLAVTDPQAKLLALAEEKGKLKMVLRGNGEVSAAEKESDANNQALRDLIEGVEGGPAVAAAPAPAAKMDTVVVARKPVPVNTLVNADNVNEFFTTLEVKAAPEGVVTNPDDLKGKFIVKPLDQGQTLFKSLTDGRMKDPEIRPEVKPETTPETKPETKPEPVAKLPRFEQVIQEGGHARKVIWVEVAKDKWKRFDTEKDADEYKPDADGPKADAPKGDSPKAADGQ